MILFEGKLLPEEKLNIVLEKLWDSCLNAIENRTDISVRVMEACGRISEKIKTGEYDDIIQQLLRSGTFPEQQLDEMELGTLRRECNMTKRLEPLGILFHIAVGNVNGFPFYSVLEGMIAGNVNILKLPYMDNGLTVRLFHEMVQEEPILAPYVCVLDIPFTKLAEMKPLAEMADGIVVWGGDETVRAMRNMADPSTEIMNWGHKISFAYVTPDMFEDGDDAKKDALYALAEHICDTKQLLCSSCQGIFVDSEDEEVILTAAEKFLKILEEVSARYPRDAIGIRGKRSIELYNEELQTRFTGRKIRKGKDVSVIASMEQDLTPSYRYKNCWIRPLARKNIVRILKRNREYLQTVGLICPAQERETLADLLVKAGITRVAEAGDMSYLTPGEVHDGEYSLRSYCRIVEVENA